MDFEHTWWRSFQKRIVRTKLDIYVFLYIPVSGKEKSKH